MEQLVNERSPQGGGLCGELGMVNKQKYGRIMTASNSSTLSPNFEERAQ
jgi:hypothetical protein